MPRLAARKKKIRNSGTGGKTGTGRVYLPHQDGILRRGMARRGNRKQTRLAGSLRDGEKSVRKVVFRLEQGFAPA